jgi:1,4-alpha-glucan branching enzyme
MIRRIDRQRIQFSLDRPSASNVYLLGEFNDWDERSLPMEKDKQGAWVRQIELSPGTYRYAYLVDGKRRLDDVAITDDQTDDSDCCLVVVSESS